MGGSGVVAGFASPGMWLFPAIGATAVAIAIAGFVALRPRVRPTSPPQVVARAGDTGVAALARSGVDECVARLEGPELVSALGAVEELATIARRDRASSDAVIAVWCDHLRRDPALRDERVARAVQHRLCAHLKRVARPGLVRGRATTAIDLSDTQLHNLDLDGITIGELSLVRARLTGTTRLSLQSWGGLDATEAYFGGDVLAGDVSVERRLSLRAATIDGSLDLSASAVFGELDLSASEVAERTSLRHLVGGTLRLRGIDRAALFGGHVDLSHAIAEPVLLDGDEFTAGVTITPATTEELTRLDGDETDLAEQVREALEAPLRV